MFTWLFIEFLNPPPSVSASLRQAARGYKCRGGCQDCKCIYHHSFISCLHLYSHHCSKHSQLFQANAIAENMTAFLKLKLLTMPYFSIIISSRILLKRIQFRSNFVKVLENYLLSLEIRQKVKIRFIIFLSFSTETKQC